MSSELDETRRTKLLLVVSDFHAGSIYGLWPPSVQVQAGQTSHSITYTKGQEALWQAWLGFLQDVREARPDAVVVNGDLIDGRQKAQLGTEALTVSMSDQREGAIAILQTLREAIGPDVPMYFVQGTEYHDEKAGDEAEKVAESLFGTLAPEGVGVGKHSKEGLNLEFTSGVVVNIQHGISVAGGLYRATPLDREGVWSALAGKEGKFPKADAVIRSHAHYFCHVEHQSKHIVITPCWQLQTRYMRRNSAYRMLPDIGGLFIYIDPAAKATHDDPIRIRKILFDMPPVETTKVPEVKR